MGWGRNYMATTVQSFSEAKDYLKGKEFRKIAHETDVISFDESIGVRYHNTNVVEFHKNGSITLKTNNWITPTTKRRIDSLNSRYEMTNNLIIDTETRFVYPIGIFSDGVTLPYERTMLGEGDVKEDDLYIRKESLNGVLLYNREYSKWDFGDVSIYCGTIQENEKANVYWAFSGKDILVYYDRYIYKLNTRIGGFKVCFNPVFLKTKDNGLFITTETVGYFSRIETRKCGFFLKEGKIKEFVKAENDFISSLGTTTDGEMLIFPKNSATTFERIDYNTFKYNGDVIKFKRKKVIVKKSEAFGRHLYIKSDRNKNYVFSEITKKLIQIPDANMVEIENQFGISNGILTFTYRGGIENRILSYEMFYYYDSTGKGIKDAVKPLSLSEEPIAKIVNRDTGTVEFLSNKKQLFLGCYILSAISHEDNLYILTQEDLKMVCYKVRDGEKIKIYPRDFISIGIKFEDLVLEFSKKSLREIMINNVASML